MSERHPAEPPQAVKLAQQHSVLRFMALHELLGDRLLEPGSALELAPATDTPLSLLRGLGWHVGYVQPDSGAAATIEAVYALPASSDLPLDEVDLVILNDAGGLVGETLDAMREGAWLIVSLPLGGGTRAMTTSLAAIETLLVRLRRRKDVGAAVFRTIFRHRWLLLQKRAKGSCETSVARAHRKVSRQLVAVRLASKIPLAGRAFSLATITAAHPRGRQQAAYKLWAIRRKKQLANSVVRLAGNRAAVTHFGVHAPANAGDRVLFEAVRAAIDPGEALSWALRDVRAPVTEATIDKVNASRGLVIGGGGLFLVDLDSTSPSGWQWPCPPPLLDKINVPIVVFAVGYNRFRGQSEFPTAFVDSLTKLVEKAAFIGIRNHGSIRALKEYMPVELGRKFRFQPCPTTVMRYLNLPGVDGPVPVRNERRLVINTAFDRYAMRMAGREERTLGSIAQMARLASQSGWQVTVAGHLFDDEAIRPFMDKAGVPYDVCHFTGVKTEDILRFYRSVDLVVGMRGHAQMIPFGVGTPIISLIAHDKMGWFLDDIGHPEWGVDFNDPDFSDRLKQTFVDADGNLEGQRAEIANARERLWALTRENVATVRDALALETLAR